MRLLESFFRAEVFNPSPRIILNLSGSDFFDKDTVFPAGRYKIEVAPGMLHTFNDTWSSNTMSSNNPQFSYLEYEEEITEPFMIRAYCGSNATNNQTGGINQYVGNFKVNSVDARLLPNSHSDGISVDHIFGAQGGSAYNLLSSPTQPFYVGGNGNCLGNGNCIQFSTYDGNSEYSANGAGSCLHLLPLEGVFGTDYIRTYHAQSFGGGPASSFGGAQAGYQYTSTGWWTKGGSSPNGIGGQNNNSLGTGIGSNGDGAYFNGKNWINVPKNIIMVVRGVKTKNFSRIKITFLGPL